MSRKRWVYTEGGKPLAEPVEVDMDWRPPDAERMPVFTDRYMEGTQSPVDGSDIGSRTKRREHMRAHGLADADDFKGQWANAEQQRAAFFEGKRKDPERREMIGRTAYELSKRRNQ